MNGERAAELADERHDEPHAEALRPGEIEIGRKPLALVAHRDHEPVVVLG